MASPYIEEAARRAGIITKVTHTPGPWHENDGFIYGDNPPLIVCDPHCDVADHDEREANARLIASAPDLLEAVIDLRKELREHIKLDVKKHYSLMVADAAAGTAIAKATKP